MGNYYGLTGNIAPDEREIPHHKGNYMSFRPLSGKQVKKARSAMLKEHIEDVGADTMEMFQRLNSGKAQGEDNATLKEAERIAAEAAKDPLAGYSDTVLLRHGLVSWRGDAYERACDDERKDELDETTRRWAALQVLEVSHISEGEAGRSDPTSNGTGAESQPASLGSGSLS